jgi:hypothetical protein
MFKLILSQTKRYVIHSIARYVKNLYCQIENSEEEQVDVAIRWHVGENFNALSLNSRRNIMLRKGLR